MYCLYCNDPILPGEKRVPVNFDDVLHRECHIRMLVGSVGHLMKTCSCYGGNEEDPPDMTKHEAAHAATFLYWILTASKEN
jgi:hypothetical protein